MTASFRSVRPVEGEFPVFMAGYISQVQDGDIIEILKAQTPELVDFMKSIPESMGDYQYAPDKWSIKEVIGHMADTERVFAYRAMRFSRADLTPVEGFDENSYVANAPFARASLPDLIDEFDHVRRASVHLFENLDEKAFANRGVANGKEVTVRSLAYIVAGHAAHHRKVLTDRYLSRKPE
jgi:hypothetical protein